MAEVDRLTGSATSPLVRSVEAYKCYELRIQGYSYDEISVETGLSPEVCKKYVTSGLNYISEELSEQVEEIRALESARLDALILAHWSRRGDPRSAELILKVMDRRAKLHALDQKTNDFADTAQALREFLRASAENIGAE